MRGALEKIFRYFKRLPLGQALKLSLFYTIRKGLNPKSKVFYSQHGEDGLIQFLIGESDGFYIDVGCNHPVEISNTFRFYLQGWKGLCIDANESLIRQFKETRKQDKVVCSAVSEKAEELEFFEFDCDTVSTVDKELAEERTGRWGLKQIRKVRATTLDLILEEAYPNGHPKISLLSIDIEGYSLQALRSFNLEEYQPRLIVIEIDDFDFETSSTNETVVYLKQHNYKLEAFDSKNGYFFRIGQR